jgi:hypothetical protein
VELTEGSHLSGKKKREGVPVRVRLDGPHCWAGLGCSVLFFSCFFLFFSVFIFLLYLLHK